MANRTDYIAIIKSDEYKNKLKKMAQDIKNASKVAPNEATIESRFDGELFAFFKDMFETLGFIYNPIKEKSINTARHISKGRADTAIASLVIEFKQPSNNYSIWHMMTYQSNKQLLIEKNHWKNCWVINFQIEMMSIYLYTHFKQLMPLLLKQ